MKIIEVVTKKNKHVDILNEISLIPNGIIKIEDNNELSGGWIKGIPPVKIQKNNLIKIKNNKLSFKNL